ncbi:MAG: DUF2911 domain-containing protein [Pseudomonadota bacterium]
MVISHARIARCLFAAAGLCLAGRTTRADVELPPASPPASVSQQVGITTIRVDYARAALGGRALPAVATAGRIWVPGESTPPRIAFSREVDFLGVPVAAGTYTLLAIPGPADWILILNRDVYLTAAGRYRPDLDVLRARARVHAGPHRDRLEFAFADFNNEGGVLQLAWGDLRVDVPIAVHTQAQIAAAIGALDDAWRWYADAADYMLKVRRDPDAGLRYVEQSLALQTNDRNTFIRASLLAAKQRHPSAFAKRTRAVAAAQRPEPATAPLSLAHDDVENRVFHATIEPAAAAGGAADERAAPAQPEIASKPPAPSEIAAVIKRGRAELQGCYQRALRKDPSLTRARVAITIHVGVSGMAKAIRLDPPHPPAALETCIRGTVPHWAFPASSVEYQAELPLVIRGTN